jgi:hypothetical protein
VSDLREDLDRALRTVTFGEAPVERAKRAGRRIRTRRRAGLLAGALAVVAVAAGYPALTGSGASAPPAPTTSDWTPPPTPKLDPPVTVYEPITANYEADRLTSKTGEIDEGSIGNMIWQMSVVPPSPKNPVPADSCYTITISEGINTGGSIFKAADAGGSKGGCNDLPASLGSGLGADKPAAFTVLRVNGTMAMTVGEAADDVDFFTVLFSDGQQSNLPPVTFGGHSYIAWMAPLYLTTASVTAHIGPYAHPTQTATAVPFQLKGQPPVFGRWQGPGQPAPKRATGVIGSGATGGHAWKVTAYEGPWGTCFSTDPGSSQCVWADNLDTTRIIGRGDGIPVEGVFGSAAPGVASVRITLSNGTTATAHPVLVGNEDLFAFPAGSGVIPTGWTAYDASGQQAGSGATTG